MKKATSETSTKSSNVLAFPNVRKSTLPKTRRPVNAHNECLISASAHNSKGADHGKLKGFIMSYTVEVTHRPGGISFIVDGTAADYRSRCAVATALEAIAKSLRE